MRPGKPNPKRCAKRGSKSWWWSKSCACAKWCGCMARCDAMCGFASTHGFPLKPAPAKPPDLALESVDTINAPAPHRALAAYANNFFIAYSRPKREAQAPVLHAYAAHKY